MREGARYAGSFTLGSAGSALVTQDGRIELTPENPDIPTCPDLFVPSGILRIASDEDSVVIFSQPEQEPLVVTVFPRDELKKRLLRDPYWAET